MIGCLNLTARPSNIVRCVFDCLLFTMMKTAVVLLSLLSGATAFGVAPRVTVGSSTALSALIAEEDMTADQLEILKISQRWSEIRMMDREQAEKELDGEWLEAYNRFFEKYDQDMESMQLITDRLQKAIEPPKVSPKTKGQRKRDAYAKVLAREAARAAKK